MHAASLELVSLVGLFGSVLPTLPFPYETFFFDPKGIKYLLMHDVYFLRTWKKCNFMCMDGFACMYVWVHMHA